MNKLQFKTNLKCSGCVDKLSPHMNKLVGKDNWEINLESPDKTLTVNSEVPLKEEDIVKAVKDAGYKAEK